MNDWTNERMNGCIDGWMDEWMNERMNEQTNEWMTIHITDVRLENVMIYNESEGLIGCYLCFLLIEYINSCIHWFNDSL